MFKAFGFVVQSQDYPNVTSMTLAPLQIDCYVFAGLGPEAIPRFPSNLLIIRVPFFFLLFSSNQKTPNKRGKGYYWDTSRYNREQ